jgi:ATP-binding cassette subfamily B protein
MDKIIVLNDGKLDAFGTHEELLKTSEIYQRMVFLQELEKEVEGGAN